MSHEPMFCGHSVNDGDGHLRPCGQILQAGQCPRHPSDCTNPNCARCTGEHLSWCSALRTGCGGGPCDCKSSRQSASAPSVSPPSTSICLNCGAWLGGPHKPTCRMVTSGASGQAPVPMILHCPECMERHIDVGEFATKVHHTHACQSCGLTWRPAIVATVGVRFLPGFKNEPERFSSRPNRADGTADSYDDEDHDRESLGPDSFSGTDYPHPDDVVQPERKVCKEWVSWRGHGYPTICGKPLGACPDHPAKDHDDDHPTKAPMPAPAPWKPLYDAIAATETQAILLVQHYEAESPEWEVAYQRRIDALERTIAGLRDQLAAKVSWIASINQAATIVVNERTEQRQRADRAENEVARQAEVIARHIAAAVHCEEDLRAACELAEESARQRREAEKRTDRFRTLAYKQNVDIFKLNAAIKAAEGRIAAAVDSLRRIIAMLRHSAPSDLCCPPECVCCALQRLVHALADPAPKPAEPTTTLYRWRCCGLWATGFASREEAIDHHGDQIRERGRAHGESGNCNVVIEPVPPEVPAETRGRTFEWKCGHEGALVDRMGERFRTEYDARSDHDGTAGHLRGCKPAITETAEVR